MYSRQVVVVMPQLHGQEPLRMFCRNEDHDGPEGHAMETTNTSSSFLAILDFLSQTAHILLVNSQHSMFHGSFSQSSREPHVLGSCPPLLLIWEAQTVCLARIK
jgi:hypothetical protein